MTKRASFSSAAFTTASGVAVAATADIEIRNEDDGAYADITSDEAGTTPIAQPGFQADASGRFLCYALGRHRGYKAVVTKGAETHTVRNIAIGTAAQRDFHTLGIAECSSVGGTANAITCALDAAIDAYRTDQRFFLTPASTNTGSATLTPTPAGGSALSAKTIKKRTSGGKVALVAGDLVSGNLVLLIYDGTDLVLEGVRQRSHGADVASAGTINLDTATGDCVDVTGTTTITAITLAEGEERTVRFTGSLTLTNGASLVLLGGANIQTAAGDYARFRGYAAGVVRMTDYSKIAATSPLSFTLATPQATTSGTSKDFTGIPSGCKRITMMFSGVSTNGTSLLQVQIGDSGGIENTGYLSNSGGVNNTGGVGSAASAVTSGFQVTGGSPGAGDTWHGQVILTLIDASTFTWTASGALYSSGGTLLIFSAGSKSTSAELDRVRLTTINGTDTFDAGKVNISYEY